MAMPVALVVLVVLMCLGASSLGVAGSPYNGAHAYVLAQLVASFVGLRPTKPHSHGVSCGTAHTHTMRCRPKIGLAGGRSRAAGIRTADCRTRAARARALS